MKAANSQGQSVALTKRGVPDVAGDADPETGYDVRIDGTNTVIGGTSAVAPLWAALLARINQVSGKPAGYINPLLYQNAKALRDITRATTATSTRPWAGMRVPGSVVRTALRSAACFERKVSANGTIRRRPTGRAVR